MPLIHIFVPFVHKRTEFDGSRETIEHSLHVICLIVRPCFHTLKIQFLVFSLSTANGLG